MYIRSQAPLRLGLGGGGTDLTAYSNLFGGCVVNLTIDLYAHCQIREIRGPATFISQDKNADHSYLSMHRAVYNRVTKDWNAGKDLAVRVETYCDAPTGSGLGSSSALVVAQLIAYSHLLKKVITRSELATLAYQIERIDMEMSGGLQDQWASAYGGLNFFEFRTDSSVAMHPLILDTEFSERLQNHFYLFHTGIQRCSTALSRKQSENTLARNAITLDGLHSIKADALFVREVLQKGDLISFASSLRRSWEAKKLLAEGITNLYIENIYNAALSAGAIAGKIVGAGGGGFMLFLVAPHERANVSMALSKFPGKVVPVHFSQAGAQARTIQEENLCQKALTH